MRHLSPPLLALVATLAAACTASTPAVADGQVERMVLEVAPGRIPCVGEMEALCLQVRSPGEEGWRAFYDPIEGFRHEDGVRYTIEVVRSQVADPPADASAYTYRLIRVMEREPEGDG